MSAWIEFVVALAEMSRTSVDALTMIALGGFSEEELDMGLNDLEAKIVRYEETRRLLREVQS